MLCLPKTRVVLHHTPTRKPSAPTKMIDAAQGTTRRDVGIMWPTALSAFASFDHVHRRLQMNPTVVGAVFAVDPAKFGGAHERQLDQHDVTHMLRQLAVRMDKSFLGVGIWRS